MHVPCKNTRLVAVCNNKWSRYSRHVLDSWSGVLGALDQKTTFKVATSNMPSLRFTYNSVRVGWGGFA